MISEYLHPENIQVVQHVRDWQQAVDIVSSLLLEHGDITSSYVEAMKNSISAPGGTYIDMGGGIALAHARPETGVVHTSLSLLHTVEPFDLAGDPKHPITVMYCLAAQDANTHIELMQSLAQLLTDEAARDEINACETTERLRQVMAKF